MCHRDANGLVATADRTRLQTFPFGAHKDGKTLALPKFRGIQRDGFVCQRHGRTFKSSLVQYVQTIMWPDACLGSNTSPRNLENGSHRHADSTTIQRIAACGTHQNAIDVKGCRTPEDSADIRVIHNSLEHADAHGASLGTRIQRGEKGTRIGQQWATKRSERATRHRKTGKIAHEVHRPYKRRNIEFGTLLFQTLKKRLQLRHPTLAQKKAHRLEPRIDSALDHLGALGDKDAFLGLKDTTKLTLRQFGIGIKTLVLKGLDTYELRSPSPSTGLSTRFLA